MLPKPTLSVSPLGKAPKKKTVSVLGNFQKRGGEQVETHSKIIFSMIVQIHEKAIICIKNC